MEKVEHFSTLSYGYGDGSGPGSGSGSGSGLGYVYGYGDGSGSGSGAGYGYGYGYGDGSGHGSGDGDGSGDGSGYGYGYGYGIKTVCGNKVHRIDGIPTIIKRIISDNAAKGYILNKDMTLSQTWVVKGNDTFAHGETLREAQAALEAKLFKDMSIEDRIAEFIKRFEFDKKYPATEFFEWHNKLTGSCLQGREHFVKSNNIDLTSEFTPQEFIGLCENAYGGEIIKQLKKEYQK